MKKILFQSCLRRQVFSLLVFWFFCTSVPAFAKVISSEEAVAISTNQIVDDDLYIGAPTIDVSGAVNGDLYVGGGTVNIAGEVEGDVLAGGGMINISGKIGGNVRAAGGQISISNAEIGGSLSTFGGSVSVDEKTKIGGGVLVGAGMVDIDADVARGIVGGAGTLAIGGRVNKEIKVAVDTLSIKKGAEIAGDISYISENEIGVDEKAIVSGKVSQTIPQGPELPKGLPGIAKKIGLGFKVWAFSAALLIGSILLYLLPKHTEAISTQILKSPWQSLFWGFLGGVLIWPLIFLLTLTGIGAPLGLILLGIFILELYLAKIFVGLLFGRSLLEFFGKKQTSAYVALILGLAVYYVLISLPIIGVFTFLATLVFGLGALFIFQCETLTALHLPS